ncbi:hypothetical protein ACHAPJ_003109, partial [Fusarium lateritium]
HIKLPFEIKDGNGFHSKLWDLFPNTISINEGPGDPFWLHFTVRKLPRRPWPLTINGVPFTIAGSYKPAPKLSCASHRELYGGEVGRGQLIPHHGFCLATFGEQIAGYRICQSFDGTQDAFSDRDLRLIASKAAEEIPKHNPHVDLIELVFTLEKRCIAVLSIGSAFRMPELRLPWYIANCPVRYTAYEKENFHLPEWASWDSNPIEEYNRSPRPLITRLSPRSMLHGNHGPPGSPVHMLRTAPGVLIKDKSKHCFMTVARHAVGRHNEIRPGSRDGEHVLGKVVHEIPCTDTALVKLEGDVVFANDILDEKQSPKLKKLARLFGEDPEDKLEWNTVVRFASPSALNVDGVIAAKSVKLHKSPRYPKEPIQCVVYHWAWTGQTEDWGSRSSFRSTPVKPGEATSGTALVDENGVVVGLSRHAVGGGWAGFSVMLSASELVEAGYKLA